MMQKGLPLLISPLRWQSNLKKMFKLQKKETIDQSSLYTVPLIAIGCSLIFVFILFLLIGKNPVLAIFIIFIEPLLSIFGLSELIVKATPLIIIALGLSI